MSDATGGWLRQLSRLALAGNRAGEDWSTFIDRYGWPSKKGAEVMKRMVPNGYAVVGSDGEVRLSRGMVEVDDGDGLPVIKASFDVCQKAGNLRPHCYCSMATTQDLKADAVRMVCCHCGKVTRMTMRDSDGHGTFRTRP